MQTIVKLPVDKLLLPLLKLPEKVYSTIENYLNFTTDISNAFSSFSKIENHLRTCKEINEIHYVKTFPEDEKFDMSEIRHFICYGNYNRNKSIDDECLFLRVDQEGLDLGLLKDKSERFKKLIPYLSGAIFSRPDFPEIIIEEQFINKQEKFEDNYVDNLFLFSKDYFGKLSYLNNTGQVVEYFKDQLTNTSLTLDDWIDKELRKFK